MIRRFPPGRSVRRHAVTRLAAPAAALSMSAAGDAQSGTASNRAGESRRGCELVKKCQLSGRGSVVGRHERRI